jgi:hypothetical protein
MKPFAAVLFAALAAAAPGTPAATPASRAWPQWGGLDRNFIVPDADLVLTWPSAGPKRIWERPLGDGFSSIVSDGLSLYTLYRDGPDDVVVSLDAETGRTVWDAR